MTKTISRIDKKKDPHINEIAYHLYMQMKYEECYAEIDQKTDEFLWKWGDIHLILDTTIKCVLSTGMKVLFHLYVPYFFHACKMKEKH